MDERKEMRKNEPGIDTADQPAEGGPYIEDRAAAQQAEEQRTGTHDTEPERENRTEHLREQVTHTDRLEYAPIPLFDEQTAEQFRTRWLAIQSAFVDDPGDAVKQADDLVLEVIQGVARNFTARRDSFEQEWNGGGKSSTEDLRVSLKQYRSFIERLLTIES